MSADEEDEVSAEEEGASGGGAPLASYVAFLVRALRRHVPLALGVFVALTVLTILASQLWPRTYQCQSRLLATKNKGLWVKSDDYGEVLKGASDLVMRHDNLESIIKQANLVARAEETRPAIVRWKDAIADIVRGPLSDEERLRALTWTLADRMTVTVEDLTITITSQWTDAALSARIADAAQKNFLETRRVAEISTLGELISILEVHAARLRTEVDGLAKQIRKLRTERLGEKLGRPATPAADASAEPPAPVKRVAAPARLDTAASDEELARLKVLLDAKKRAIADLEDNRNRRLVEQQAKLTELKGKFTDAHPQVIDVKQNISTLSHESPQVTALRSEVQGIEGDMKARSAKAAEAGARGESGGRAESASSAAPLPVDVTELLAGKGVEVDPAVAAQFRYAVDSYASLRGQISAAKVDLDTAQAAFKYRYKVVVPAEAPTKALKPKVPIVIGGGLFLALLAALAAVVIAELRVGMLVEDWQVQQIQLPLLAELRFPPKASSTRPE